MIIERMKKTVYVVFVMMMLVSTLALGQESGEAAPEGAGGINPEEIFMLVGKMDFGRQLMFMWWTDQVWASLAYSDRNSEAVLGYILINMLNKNYMLFSPIPISGDASSIPEIAEAPALTNDRGQSVTAVPVHESFSTMLPAVMAFPVVDAEGNQVFDDETEYLKLEVKYAGEEDSAKYTWDLPIKYPDFVNDAYNWLDGRMNMDPSELSEEEVVFGHMRDVFRIDVGSGLMVSPMPKEIFDMFMEKDPELKDSPLTAKLAKAIINDYTFFLVMSLDIGQNPDRVRGLIENAVVVNDRGETFSRDLEAEETFAEAAGKDDQFMSIVFPKLGESGYKLILTDPETGGKITLEW